MRLLTRLVLAGAAAATAWLLTGVVTIRALDDPTRIGLLPGVEVPLVSFAILLTLSGAVRRPERAAPIVALACAASLPWWPVAWPPAVLLLTGPLGWAWFLACLLAVVEVPRGGWWWWRAHRVFADPWRAQRLAAGLTALLLATSAWIASPRHPDGDELDYLMIAQSLASDGDLRIENNHRQFEYEAWHDGVLLPSYLQRGRDGQIYPVHAAGLPVSILPAFAALGYRGAVAIVILVSALGAGLLWRLAYALTESATAAWLATGAAAGAAPWFLHARVLFPDAPAAVLLLVGLWPLVEPGAFTARRMAWPSLALVALPWMHTRFAVLAAGAGVALVVAMATRKLMATRAERVWFFGPAVIGAVAWLGFFWAIYGTPDPSAPYGDYTQTAWRHIPTGLAGLLVDQQFGLLATAPVLALAAIGALRGWRAQPSTHARTDDPAMATTTLIVGIVATAVIYTLLTASYRMWWGGLSAPARFLAPLVLPLGLLVALGWRTLQSRTSRSAALVLLAVSLVVTATMATVDEGRLAYNERDAVARWAAWASPLVDLAAALPASHRDGPGLVARDAAVWLLVAAAAWGVVRASERRWPVTRARVIGATLAVGLVAPSVVWALRDAVPWQPLPSQVAWLEAESRMADARPLLLTPPPDGPARRWFELDLQSPPGRADDPFTAAALEGLPAGRYRLLATGLDAGTRLGVAVGRQRATAFITEVVVRQGRAVAEVLLPMPVDRLVVRASARDAGVRGRVWLRNDDLFAVDRDHSGRRDAPATRTTRVGPVSVFVQERGAFAEPEGVWLAGDAEGTLGISGPPRLPVTVTLTAGAAPVDIDTQVAQRRQHLRLAPGETGRVDLGRLPSRGVQRLRFRVTGGFRPALAAGSDDGRKLGAWLTLDQNLTTPLK